MLIIGQVSEPNYLGACFTYKQNMVISLNSRMVPFLTRFNNGPKNPFLGGSRRGSKNGPYHFLFLCGFGYFKHEDHEFQHFFGDRTFFLGDTSLQKSEKRWEFLSLLVGCQWPGGVIRGKKFNNYRRIANNLKNIIFY